MSKIIAIANQKGGCGKSTTAVNLGIGLVRKGKRVLIVDADPQGSASISLGVSEPDELDYTLANAMLDVINDEDVDYEKLIHHHNEGVDFIPANIELSGLEVSMVSVMRREMVMKCLLEWMNGHQQNTVM